MYIPSLNEFSSLNYLQKIQIVENIQNIIEAQKKNYLRNNNNEILISSYYPRNKELNINSNTNTENDLSSSISSDDTETRNEKDIIHRAKNNIINFKKDLEQFKSQYILYKLNNEKNINVDKIKETIPDQEINYIIETTNIYNKSNNISFNNKNNKIDFSYSKNDTNNKSKIPFDNYKTYTHSSHNYNNNLIMKKEKNKKSKNYLYYNNTMKSHRINSSNNIAYTIPNKKIIQSQSVRHYSKTNSNINNKFRNNNNIENIKKKLNFNKVSYRKSNKSLMKAISNSNRKKINTDDISNRLYNMHNIIKEKIIMKKQELEEEEMKNCSFVPKINDKSKKIVKDMEKREIKCQNQIYKKINIYNFFNKNKI